MNNKNINTKKLDAALLWKQLEDVLVPALQLTHVDRAVYSVLLRHTLLEGKSRLRVSMNWLASAVRLTNMTARRSIRRLVDKGVLRLCERTRDGHLIELLHPDQICAAVGAPDSGSPNLGSSAGAPASSQPLNFRHLGSLSGPAVIRRRCSPQFRDIEKLDFLSTAPLRAAIHARERGRCFYCLRRLKPRARCLDHVVPQFRSGGNSYRNLVSCCLECNSQKRDKPATDFLRSLYREHRLTAAEFSAGLRKLHALTSGRLRPALP